MTARFVGLMGCGVCFFSGSYQRLASTASPFTLMSRFIEAEPHERLPVRYVLEQDHSDGAIWNRKGKV